MEYDILIMIMMIELKLWKSEIGPKTYVCINSLVLTIQEAEKI